MRTCIYHHKERLKLFICVLILLGMNRLLAEQDYREYNPENHYWGLIVGVGAGTSFSKAFGGFAGTISPSYQHGNHIYNIRHSAVGELYMEGPQPERYVIDTSLLYGRCNKGSFYYTSFSAGLGWVRGMKRGKYLGHPAGGNQTYEESPFSTVGISADVQLFILTPYFGVGTYLYGNLNTKQAYCTFLLCFKFGYLVDFK